MAAGVLNQQEMRNILSDGDACAWVPAPNLDSLAIDGSAVDLPIGTRFWKMKASCRGAGIAIDQIKDTHKLSGPHPLEPNTVFERDQVYWVELSCTEVRLPPHICARATAKSSIGRLDAMVRLVAENEVEFDKISEGRSAKIYLEIVPITFRLRLSPGDSLSQLRFIRGDESLCRLPAKAVLLEDDALIDKTRRQAQFAVFPDDVAAVPLTLDLSNDDTVGACGYRAIRPTSDNDVPISPGQSNTVEPEKYWEKISADRRGVVIQKDQFYIFRSRERFRIPSHLCVDCRAYSEGLGDIRIHYAGFAHPLFGRQDSRGGNISGGAPLIFEVRGFSMNSVLQDAAVLAKVYFLRMSSPSNNTDGAYSQQELKLSKVFKAWRTG